MVAYQVEASYSAPLKSRILTDTKCGKCCRVVKNGILCDRCDRWNHFRCAKVSEEEIPDENEEWFCPRCTDADTNAILNGSISELEQDSTSMIEIINTLKEDIASLKAENAMLRKNCEASDLNLSKIVSQSIEKPNLNIGLDFIETKPSPRRWESVPVSKGCRTNHLPEPKNYPPLSNSFEVLDEAEEDDLPNMKIPAAKTKLPHCSLSLKGKNARSNKTYQNRKSRHSNSLKIFSDSYGRGLASILSDTTTRLGYNVEGTVKPSAKFTEVVKHLDAKNLTSKDFVVIIGGANDVSCNQTSEATSTLKRTLAKLTHTNVIVVDIPRRHDLMKESCVNKEIDAANIKYRSTCTNFLNVSLIKTSYCDRAFHTGHGQHFNMLGKEVLAKIVNKIIRDKLSHVKKVLTVPVSNQGNDLL